MTKQKFEKMVPRFEQICIPAVHCLLIIEEYHNFEHDGFARL